MKKKISVQQCPSLTINQAKNWLDKIGKELTYYIVMKNRFQDVHNIYMDFQNTENIENHYFFTELIQVNCLYSITLGISRICDKHPKTNSLINFLHALKNSKDILTKESFLNRYFDGLQLTGYIRELEQQKAEELFSQLAGEASDTYSIRRIDEFIKRLKENPKIRGMIKFRNKYIAHSDIQRPEPPCYDSIKDSLCLISIIVTELCLLIKCSAHDNFGEVTEQGEPWNRIFELAWTTPDNNV